MRNPLIPLVGALAIAVAACGTTTTETTTPTTPETTTSVAVVAETTSLPETTTPAAVGTSADEARAAFVAAVSNGDTGQVGELLAAAQPDPNVQDTLAAMMADGVVMEAGSDDCEQPEGCFVFTDWSMAFTLQMEAGSDANWSITGINVESTD